MGAHSSTVKPDVSSYGGATTDAAGNSIRKSQLEENPFDIQQGANIILSEELKPVCVV